MIDGRKLKISANVYFFILFLYFKKKNIYLLLLTFASWMQFLMIAKCYKVISVNKKLQALVEATREQFFKNIKQKLF